MRILIVVFLCLFTIAYSRIPINVFQNAVNGVRDNIDPSSEADKEKAEFYEYYELIAGFDFGKLWSSLSSGHATEESCLACSQFIGFARAFITNAEILKTLAHSVCQTADFYSPRVCDGTITLVAEPLTYILQNTKLNTQEICSVLINSKCMTLLNQTMTKMIEWELPLPARKEFKPVMAEASTKKMLHLTDVHLDLWYTPGSNSECEEPLCCRSTSHGNNYSAGYWSETYGDCDAPLHFVADSIKHIGETHKDIDLVVWTGDSVPHDVWNTTAEVNLLHLKAVTDLMSQAFPDKQVLPCLGNHEAHPINLFVPYEVTQKSNFSMKWLYDTLADDYWSKWIDTPEAKATFKKGGYYSKMISPALKLVALNNNHGYRSNFWVAYNPVDPDGQLAWLIQQLDDAETHGQYVIIIGHIPPGNDNYQAWNHNYIKIVERYTHLIVGAYNGHTHNDEIVLLYTQNSQNKSIPVGMNYVGPSLTTFSYLNPAYRIFTINQNGQPLDFMSYYTDVIESNKNGMSVSPKWYFEYSPKTSYKFDNLSLETWVKFVEDSRTNEDLARLYHLYYHRESAAYEAYFVKENNITVKQKKLQDTRLFDPYILV